jgi:hypothetical protein
VVELHPNYHCGWSFQFGQPHGQILLYIHYGWDF